MIRGYSVGSSSSSSLVTHGLLILTSWVGRDGEGKTEQRKINSRAGGSNGVNAANRAVQVMAAWLCN